MTEGKDWAISDPMQDYLRAMSWWNAKTTEQKFAYVGIETIDKWVEGIIRDEFLGEPLAECQRGAVHSS